MNTFEFLDTSWSYIFRSGFISFCSVVLRDTTARDRCVRANEGWDRDLDDDGLFGVAL